MSAARPPGGGMTISDQLARHARTAGHRVALVDGTRRPTYRELDERVTRLAGALRARGVRPGGRVAVLAPNSLEVLETYFAIARLGAICVPLNFRLTPGELDYLLADSGATLVVAHAALADAVGEVPRLVFGGEPEQYERALAEAGTGAEFTEIAVSEPEPALIMYTSGTTGRPKGAVLTHQNLLVHTFSYLTQLGGRPADDAVWLAATPLFHIAALAGLLPTLLRGGTVVLAPSGRFDAAATVELMARERVSSCFLVPTQWQQICALPDLAEHDLAAVRRVIWGAAPSPPTLVRALADAFPRAELTTGLAQTECSPVTTVLSGEDVLRKAGSVGTPMLNVETRVVDGEMHDVPAGAVGEIVYRGPTVMREYWNKPAETAEAFRGGWFHSGDLVRVDEDGFVHLVDRKKDMIISGGENIYAAEVEQVLTAHPRITEAAVIGVPDEKWGELPLAVLGAVDGQAPGLAEIRAWCAPRLAGYKHPRAVAIVPALPRNAGGKVRKARLRDACAAGELVLDHEGGPVSAECSFDPYDQALTEPGVWAAYAGLRTRCPVAHSPHHGGFWLLSRYDDVRTALRDPGTYSSASGHRVPTTVERGSIPINFDPPLHTSYRRLMTEAVTPDKVRALRPRLRELIGELVTDFREAGGGDFVGAVALPLPLRLLAELVGFADDTVAEFRVLTEKMWAKVAESDYADAMREIFGLMRHELAEHRRHRPPDFITALLDARVDGRELSEDEQCRMLSAFAVAGHETTMNSMSTMVYLLVEDEARQDRLRAEPELAPRYVEEMLRLRTPAQNFARRTTREVRVGDTVIPEGDAVLLSYAAANRDAERFPDPDTFDPDREMRGHLGFGWGIHQCLGAGLARAELTVLLETLCGQPPVRLAGEVTWSPLHGGHHFGPTSLPLRFDTN